MPPPAPQKGRAAPPDGESPAAAGSDGLPPLPDSIWRAPQSRLYPTDGGSRRRPASLDPADIEKAKARGEKFLRRVTRPDIGGPAPTGLQKGSQLIGGALAAACTVYALVWIDFGPREHVFSPIRRALGVHPRGYGFDPAKAENDYSLAAPRRYAGQGV